MHTLYLLRHAKSSWDDSSLTDHERPLAPRGVHAGAAIAAYLESRDVQVDLVLCSTAVRTRQTLDLIMPALGDPPVEFEDELYAASDDTLIERLRRVPDSARSVMVIGHNPGMHDLALRLAAGGDRLPQLAAKFPTAALATLELGSQRWSECDQDARLADYVVPRELG